MAELREQMKTKSTRFQSEYKNLSHGIHSKADEAKLKAMEDKHKTLLGSTSTVFSKAEEEKKRWREQHESVVEKKHKENQEKAKQTVIEEEKRKAQVSFYLELSSNRSENEHTSGEKWELVTYVKFSMQKFEKFYMFRNWEKKLI